MEARGGDLLLEIGDKGGIALRIGGRVAVVKAALSGRAGFALGARFMAIVSVGHRRVD